MMRLGRFLAATACVLLPAAAAMAAEQKAAAKTQRPNIVFIMTDQQPISTLGAYGNSQIRTPHIDRLANEGMRFNQCIIAAFPCSPSRACYWTGRWSHRHGIITNDIVLRDDLPTLGSLFRAAGYQSAFVGKWHLGGRMYVKDDKNKHSRRRVDDPNDFVYDEKGPWRGGEDQPQCGFLDKWVGGNRQFQDYLRSVGLSKFADSPHPPACHSMAPSGPEGQHIYSQIPAEHHEVAFLASEAERFIRQERDRSKPFCLVLSVYGPHLPVAPPQPWDTMYAPSDMPLPANWRDALADKPLAQKNNIRCLRAGQWSEEQFRDYIARYWGYCSYIDDRVGRVLKALDDEGIADNTIVIYTSDHGDMLGAHGFVFKLYSGYDELMRVPFIIRCPGRIAPGTASDAMVENIDVLPTLLDLCGLPADAGIDGRSFRAVLAGKAQQFRDQVVTVSQGALVLATKDWKLVLTKGSDDAPFLELYDRHEQPVEVHNRAADPAQAEVLQNMKEQLIAWLHATGYPYADVLERSLAKARTRLPQREETVFPKVESFKLTTNAQGKSVLELEVTWHVGEPLCSTAQLPAESPAQADRYWTFAQVLNKPGQAILARGTLWVEPPIAQWATGSQQRVGPVRIVLPPKLRGTYPVRVGLYCPATQKAPAVYGKAQRIVGTLSIVDGNPAADAASEKPSPSGPQVSFAPVE